MAAPASGGPSTKVKQPPQQTLVLALQQQLAHEQDQRRRLETTNAHLQAQRDALQTELRAQHKELDAAAAELTQLRTQHKEELDEILEEQEEELQNVRHEYERKNKDQREHYQHQVAELQAQLQKEREQRAQEGGDWTQEVQASMQREKEAWEQCHTLRAEAAALQERVEDLLHDQTAWQTRVESLELAAQSALARERAAEERLDAALQQHKHQLALRQTREAELEQTVAELGTALAQRQQQQQADPKDAAIATATAESAADFKAKYQTVVDELEMMQTQYHASQQRCEALAAELQEVARERTKEATHALDLQSQSDARMNELMAHVKQLEASLRERNEREGSSGGEDSEARLRQALRDSQEANASLSDELLRQQGVTEATKAEILALKGRLQAANARAEAAEQQALASDNRLLEMEGGSTSWSASKMRRRVKGGGRVSATGRPLHLSSRTARSALGLRVVHGSAMEQVALTLDAMDGFMMDAVDIMRQEPLARVGAVLYLSIVHLWCFGLVFFHTVQSERGDLGTLTHPGAALHPR